MVFAKFILTILQLSEAARPQILRPELELSSSCALRGPPRPEGAEGMHVSAFLYGDEISDHTCERLLSGFMYSDALELSYENGTLCVSGSGYESRAESQVQLLRDAIVYLNKCNVDLFPFKEQILSLSDLDSDCSRSWSFALDGRSADCNTQLVPDFAFVAWPEAGLLPNYAELAHELKQLSLQAPRSNLCGWAGSLATNSIRKRMYDLADRSLYEIVVPRHDSGTAGGRLSMQEQVQRWACLLDVPGNGYSGRIPLLLHSGRPLLLVGRKAGQPTDHTWFAEELKPWEHYIPVAHDLSDLNAKAAFALGPGRAQAMKMAARAQNFCEQHLSYDAAVAHLAARLLVPPEFQRPRPSHGALAWTNPAYRWLMRHVRRLPAGLWS